MSEERIELISHIIEHIGQTVYHFTLGSLFCGLGLSGVLAGFSSALDGYWQRNSIMCVTGITVGIIFIFIFRYGWEYLKVFWGLFITKHHLIKDIIE